MGTDIHAIAQVKKNGKWEDIRMEWEQNRHYLLFSWLADVRNGYSFAGVPTYKAITPITPPRGLPEDFEMLDEAHPTTLITLSEHAQKYQEDKEHPTKWMGDHSHSWLLASEILQTPPPTQLWHCGVVPIDFFTTWDGHTPPKTWSGEISGERIIRAPTPVDVTEETTHVRIFWKETQNELQYFIDEVKRLKDLHGDFRLVFGFDS